MTQDVHQWRIGSPFLDEESGLTVTCIGSREGITLLTFSDQDVPVGICSVMGTTIGHVEVYSRYRGQGYGQRILVGCAQLGFTEMRPVNAASRRAADKAGFVPPTERGEPWTYNGIPAVKDELDLLDLW